MADGIAASPGPAKLAVRANAVRLRPGDAGFWHGEPTGKAEINGWFTFADAPPEAQRIDAYGLLLVADAFAPVCFNSGEISPGWAPTLELTVHVRGTPAEGALRCGFRSRFIQNAHAIMTEKNTKATIDPETGDCETGGADTVKFEIQDNVRSATTGQKTKTPTRFFAVVALT